MDQSAGKIQIRSLVGPVTVSAESIVRVEKRESPWAEYETQRAQSSDTADGNFDLAAWCDRRGLFAERKRHLQRTVELDADHEGARAALGFEKTDAGWILRKPNGGDGQKSGPRPTAAEGADDDERLAAAARVQWRRQIKGIKSIMLESPIAERVDEGQRKILSISDPLAIEPMSEVLVHGDGACRLLLVDALSKFPQDDATANLSLLFLLDREPAVVDRCARELARRKDPRVASQFRAALYVNNHDGVVARAARGLAVVEDKAAVGDLIQVLTVQRDKWVETPVVGLVGGMCRTFNRQTVASADGRRVSVPPVIAFGRGVLANVANVPQFRNVTVYRTEVLEALKALTGQNFGFDVEAWARWYQEQR
ncbi:hypothetical protein RAS1_21500 [Phycisphaerae bacterium RAS1]|nr:hypothetical protein RAS1_21500 [Phycisphaerae bacterium RAS1]